MPAAAAERDTFAPILGVYELSQLIKKSPGTILADRVRAPHRVPPSCEPPGSKQPLWVLEDVIDWLRQYQRATPAAPVAPQAPAARRRGRPTKREQLERAAAAQVGGAV